MRNIVTILSFLTIQIIIISCNNKSQIKKEYTVIDIDSLYFKREILYSSIFKKAEIVPLETKEECLFGEVSQIEMFENEIYILDKMIAKSLFVFSNNGTYIKRIGTRGKGPGEYMRPGSFTIDHDTGQLFILDGKRVIQYDRDGQYINEFICKPPARPREIAAQGGFLYIDHFPNLEEKSEDLLKIYSYKGELLDGFFRYPDYNRGYKKTMSFPTSFSKHNNKIYYTKRYSDTLFFIKDNMIRPHFTLKNHKTITKGEMEEINSNFFTNSKNHFKGYKGVQYVNESDSLLMLTFNNDYTYTYLYWPNTKEYISSYFLIDDMTHTILLRAIGNIENKFISVVESSNINTFIENIKSDSTFISKGDFEKLQLLNNKHNPILIFYECKGSYKTFE